jgi:PAS domain S-box-containing protein
VTIDSDSARFTRSLRSAIFWPIVVILATAVLLLLLTIELFQVIKWSDHSYDVLAQTKMCENQLVVFQNQARGYFLTGSPIFINSIEQEHRDIDASFARLKTLVQDNPSQLIRADDLIQAKDTWLAYAENNINTRSHGIVPSFDSLILGKNIMDGVLDKFGKFNAEEESLRQQRVDRVRLMKTVLLYGGGGLALLLSFIVGQLVRRNFTDLAQVYRTALSTIEQRHAEVVRSEADLEAQKEWFRVTLSSIGDGVIVTDEVGRVVFMNQEAERLTEWKSIEAMLKPLPTVFKIVNEISRAAVEDPVAKVFREKKVVGLANHTILISALGQETPIEDSAAPIYNAEGKMLGVVLVFHDALEMRHAQNTLKAHSQDLEKMVTQRTLSLQQTVTELEAFSYTISHDLRSPLRAMQGFSQAILEDYGDKMDDHGRDYLHRIKNAAERLDRLIQDLLAYTRLSRQETPLVPLDLDRCVRDIIEHYPNLREPVAHIEVVGVLPKVWGREASLTQVISNLLGNAAKFVLEGTVPQIKIWSEDLDPRVRLWIQDNGIGIAPRDFERIFQMFVQINEATIYGGTGVGLAIVHKAMQTMHGSVGVESEEGKGSKFWVELAKAP